MQNRNNLDRTCINTIRMLSMEAVQAANSGHPGTPMALAPVVDGCRPSKPYIEVLKNFVNHAPQAAAVRGLHVPPGLEIMFDWSVFRVVPWPRILGIGPITRECGST